MLETLALPMTDLLKYLDSLSPFLQGVLGSAIFTLALYLGRLLVLGAQRGGKTAFKFISRDIVLKHILHKKYVNSQRLSLMALGNFLTISQALRWLIVAVGILVFTFGVSSFLDKQWFHLLGYYLALSAIIEANSWLKDSSDEKHIAHIDPEIKAELLGKFFPDDSPPPQNPK